MNRSLYRDLASGCFAVALLLMPASLASADWFTAFMTIEGGRDAAFERKWQAQRGCTTCEPRRCKHRAAPPLAEPPAPEPLIAPRSRFFPVPTRPVFEPQVPWFARETPVETVIETDLSPPRVAPNLMPSQPQTPVEKAPAEVPIVPTPEAEPAEELHLPLKPVVPTAFHDGWKPARKRR